MFQVWPDGPLGQVSLNCRLFPPRSIDLFTFQRMSQSCRTVSLTFLFCNVPLTLSYLALLDAALLATVL